MVNDAVGLNDTAFRHNRRFADLGKALAEAVHGFRAAVGDGTFPAEANVFRMPRAELAILEDAS